MGCTQQLDALEEVVQAVRGRCEVYLDGGVRRGTDVLKALALGARAVFVGRPVLWGLACEVRQGGVRLGSRNDLLRDTECGPAARFVDGLAGRPVSLLCF